MAIQVVGTKTVPELLTLFAELTATYAPPEGEEEKPEGGGKGKGGKGGKGGAKSGGEAKGKKGGGKKGDGAAAAASE